MTLEGSELSILVFSCPSVYCLTVQMFCYHLLRSGSIFLFVFHLYILLVVYIHFGLCMQVHIYLNSVFLIYTSTVLVPFILLSFLFFFSRSLSLTFLVLSFILITFLLIYLPCTFFYVPFLSFALFIVPP